VSKINIRGHEFEVDFLDIDQAEAMLTGESEMSAQIQALDLIKNPTMGTLAELFKSLTDFFDKSVGAGSLSTILDGKRNVGDALDAYYDLRDSMVESAQKRMDEIALRKQLPEKYRANKIRK
jgi:hypothetical protein